MIDQVYDFFVRTGWALLRTAIAGLVPFLPGLVADPEGVAPVAASTVLLLVIVAALTSLSGIPSSDASWWEMLISRGLRQFAQFAAAGIGAATLLSDVDWSTLLAGATASAISTVLIAALTVIPQPSAVIIEYTPEHAIDTEEETI